MGKPQEIWNAVLKQLQLQMTRATYEALLAGSWVVRPGEGPVNGELVVGVGSELVRERLEGRLAEVVGRTVATVVGHEVVVRFEVGSGGAPPWTTGGRWERGSRGGEVREEDLMRPTPSPQPPPKGRGGKEEASAKEWGGREEALVGVEWADPAGKGYAQHSHYGAVYWREYLGSFGWAGTVAFGVWDFVRGQFKDDFGGSRIYWTPLLEVEPEVLAAMCASRRPGQERRSGQIITGVWRRCPYFVGQCCERRDGKTWLKEDGCRYWAVGAFDVLAAERLAVVERQGRTKGQVWRIQIYRSLPYLTPKQVARLSSSSQVKHATLLREARLYRAWLGREEGSFLEARQDKVGLELGGGETRYPSGAQGAEGRG